MINHVFFCFIDVTSLIEVTRAQRMKAELAELESEKQKLLAMKEVTDIQEQLIDKRAEVKKLKGKLHF